MSPSVRFCRYVRPDLHGRAAVSGRLSLLRPSCIRSPDRMPVGVLLTGWGRLVPPSVFISSHSRARTRSPADALPVHSCNHPVPSGCLLACCAFCLRRCPAPYTRGNAMGMALPLRCSWHLFPYRLFVFLFGDCRPAAAFPTGAQPSLCCHRPPSRRCPSADAPAF